MSTDDRSFGNEDIGEVMSHLLNPKYVLEDQKRGRTLPQEVGRLLDELRDTRSLVNAAKRFADERNPSVTDLTLMRDAVRVYRARRGEV